MTYGEYEKFKNIPALLLLHGFKFVEGTITGLSLTGQYLRVQYREKKKKTAEGWPHISRVEVIRLLEGGPDAR